jgi:hypothetical protein
MCLIEFQGEVQGYNYNLKHTTEKCKNDLFHSQMIVFDLSGHHLQVHVYLFHLSTF